MKRVSTLLLFLPLLLAACWSNPAAQSGTEQQPEFVLDLNYIPSVPDTESDYPPEPVSGKTAFNYFKDERLRSGWNLGNSLDAHSGGWSEERRWGNPRINQELFNGIKAAGFDIVRVPVTWIGHIGKAPDHHIAEERLARVAEVAGFARNAGLKVIINLHHDGAVENRQKDVGWLLIFQASLLPDEYNKTTRQFVRMWRQIAVYFKNYGDWLMFESFNELHDGGWGEGSETALRSQIETLNTWNQLFTDTVRGAGGNNESRFLVIPGYCAKPKHTLADYFILPNDTANGRQLVSFHYYDPYEFGIAGRRSEWGTDGDKRVVDSDFAPFKERFIDKQIPVIVGECGAVLQLYPDDPAKEAKARESRRAYIGHVFATSRKYGLVPVYWDNGAIKGNGEKCGLFDRATGQPNSDESRILIQTMVNAVR